ncbi:hypothetical protein W97_05585 [Coniosporium apollinis CBS 100218]|uniref:Glucose-methanol-choline oxidoreductase N-terminal domain-containing protein n=1 Tax=Coniosporium apollinis (strain CBS 100218) TaxID=1168221 RepID=R7YWB4_CONA1|nr:uncharacterized protein W97_05585 [Coniosporium apollinis CBS 100218]EON66192.1 hypothetical protein W97_05585 [Coniosporium apollinis CBS 100218]
MRLLSSAAFLLCIICGIVNLRTSSASPIRLSKRADVAASYDFVIVGGGAAGLALGARLSESSNQTVLVLEAGPFPEIVASYSTPGAGQQVLGSLLDWAFVTPAQESLDNRTITYRRGRGVGGSTVINGLTYGRGSASIYDLWESLGNEGWSWTDVFPFFQKSTSFIPLEVSAYQTYDESAYSPSGPISLSYPTYVSPASTAFIEALGAVGVPTVNELNLGDNVGAKQEPLTLDARQQRSSAYDGYYKPVRNRPNLTVLPLATVRQVITEMRNLSLTATGVVFADQTSGSTMNVTARKEVILSAGTFQTPQLLMLSGIGPQETLQEFGIPQSLINENVGRHMQDHLYFSVIARSQPEASSSQVYNRIDLLQDAEMEYTANRSGPLTTPIGATYGFEQVPEADLQAIAADELLAGRQNQTHIEYLWENVYYPGTPSTILPQYPPNLDESFFSVTAALIAPVSRGNVTLQSNSIQDAPVINLNYLEAETDQRLALYAFRNLRTILAQPSLANYTIGPANGEVVPGPDITDDETILKYIKSTLLPVWHVAGTCRMLPQAQGGVVDSRLRVYGVKGLRIVDASIMPVIPDQHTQGVVFMIAEKAAQMIQEDHGF